MKYCLAGLQQLALCPKIQLWSSLILFFCSTHPTWLIIAFGLWPPANQTGIFMQTIYKLWIYLTVFFSGEINSHNNEMSDINRNIRNMQNDMIKLNTLITKEHGYKENLSQENTLMESDFIQSLRVRWNDSNQFLHCI